MATEMSPGRPTTRRCSEAENRKVDGAHKVWKAARRPTCAPSTRVAADRSRAVELWQMDVAGGVRLEEAHKAVLPTSGQDRRSPADALCVVTEGLMERRRLADRPIDPIRLRLVGIVERQDVDSTGTGVGSPAPWAKRAALWWELRGF